MGHYTICDVCGVKEKGYSTSCNCKSERMKLVINKRIGAKLLNSRCESDPYGTYIYDTWTKDGETFNTCIDMSDSDVYLCEEREPKRETNINDLSKDMVFYLAMNLELHDIISLCKASSYIKDKIIDNETFWLNKLKQDFPDEVPINNFPILGSLTNYKNIYIENYKSTRLCEYIYERGKFAHQRCKYLKVIYTGENIPGGERFCVTCLKKKNVQYMLTRISK